MSGLGFAIDVQAQGTVTLSGASGNSCAYSQLAVTPNGNVTVTCSGTTQPPPPPPPPGETFSLTPATAQVAPAGVATLAVKRNNGTAGTYNVFWELTGNGCAATQPMPAVVTFVDGGPSSMNIQVGVGPTVGSTCTAKVHVLQGVGGASGATIWDGQNISTVTVVDNPPPPPPPVTPPGCPTGFVPPENLLNASLGGQGNLLQQAQKSGQIVSIALPSVPGNWNSGTVTFSENASSPQPVTIEISVNKCPGLIESDYANACNIKSQFGHNNKVQWLARPYGGFNETSAPASLAGYGLCWAGSANTQYYVNARWTYPGCGFGLAACGFAVQWNPGPY